MGRIGGFQKQRRTNEYSPGRVSCECSRGLNRDARAFVSFLFFLERTHIHTQLFAFSGSYRLANLDPRVPVGTANVTDVRRA